MKGKIIRLLSLLLAVVLLSACGAGAARVRDDVPVDELAEKLLSGLSASEDLAKMNDSYLAGMMGLDLSKFEGSAVYISAMGTNIDEFGVFKVADGFSADEAAAQIEQYLQMRRDTFMKEYTPEEKPKLEKAQVKTLGSYVIYGILSETERKAAFGTFETELTKTN